MNILSMFKKKPVDKVIDKTEIELLEVDLIAANSERDYAAGLVESATADGSDALRYTLHKRWYLNNCEATLKDIKLRLKYANIRHCDELKRVADVKQYERKRAAEITGKSQLRMLERVLRERLGDDAESIIEEASNRVGV